MSSRNLPRSRCSYEEAVSSTSATSAEGEPPSRDRLASAPASCIMGQHGDGFQNVIESSRREIEPSKATPGTPNPARARTHFSWTCGLPTSCSLPPLSSLSPFLLLATAVSALSPPVTLFSKPPCRLSLLLSNLRSFARCSHSLLAFAPRRATPSPCGTSSRCPFVCSALPRLLAWWAQSGHSSRRPSPMCASPTLSPTSTCRHSPSRTLRCVTLLPLPPPSLGGRRPLPPFFIERLINKLRACAGLPRLQGVLRRVAVLHSLA